MPWPPINNTSISGEISSVTAQLEASRLKDRKHAAYQANNANDLRSMWERGSGNCLNPGFQFEYSDEMQSETRKKMRTAGPIPYSWWRNRGTSKEKSLSNHSSDSTHSLRRSTHKMLFTPQSLKDECLCYVLRDLAEDGILLDTIPFMPFHVKTALLALAPQVAPVSDTSLVAFLLEGEHDIENKPVDSWEDAEENVADIQAMREISELDLSNSTVSLPTLRKVMLVDSTSGVRQIIPRLPGLRSLNLSRCSLTLTSPLVSVLFWVPLTSLVISRSKSTLLSPLESLANALPLLQKLDISNSDWLQWIHIQNVDWASKWVSLNALMVTDCCQLSPQASYMDPQAQGGGPPIIIQIMSIVRHKGRSRWLEVTA